MSEELTTKAEKELSSAKEFRSKRDKVLKDSRKDPKKNRHGKIVKSEKKEVVIRTQGKKDKKKIYQLDTYESGTVKSRLVSSR